MIIALQAGCSLTWIGESEPVSFVEKFNILVSSCPIGLINSISDGEDNTEEPHEENSDDDGEEFEHWDPNHLKSSHLFYDRKRNLYLIIDSVLSELHVPNNRHRNINIPEILRADSHGDYGSEKKYFFNRKL